MPMCGCPANWCDTCNRNLLALSTVLAGRLRHAMHSVPTKNRRIGVRPLILGKLKFWRERRSRSALELGCPQTFDDQIILARLQ